MSNFAGGLVLTLVLATGGARAQAQTPSGKSPDVLIASTFVTAMTYTAALSRLDAYYDEQVGHNRSVAFPEVAPHWHFEVWHEMWAFFEPFGDRTQVTLKRPADSNSARVVKGWMLDFAGRLNAEMPLVFKEEPGLKTVEGDIYESHKDLAGVLAAQTSLRPLKSWRHGGLFVSAAPLTEVALSPSGLHGVRRLTVTTADSAAGKQLLAKLQQGAPGAAVSAAFSEEVELETEIHVAAQIRTDNIVSRAASQTLYHPQMDLKYLEERIRTEPIMQKRVAAARGYYDVRYRVDRPYARITVTWTELTGYSQATGKSEAEHDLGQVSIPNVRKPAQGAIPTARVHLETLKPGGYRVRMEGLSLTGETAKIDERIYWFDGKTFEEPQGLDR
jgi:hypothetical protein